jgi:hypothetical protein
MIYDDVMAVENGEGCIEDSYASMQRLINNGQSWRLQGSFGRSMMAAIESGRCMLGEFDTRDYWGNHIPSRSQVKAGTMGSREYVVKHYGEAWAKLMETA